MARELKVKLTEEALKDLDSNIELAIQNSLPKIGALGVSIMRDETPVSEGTLQNSVDSIVGERVVHIVATAPHGVYVALGTSPHIIYGNPVLSWERPDGVRVFFSKVNHPGTKPNRFDMRTRNRILPQISDVIIAEIKRVLL